MNPKNQAHKIICIMILSKKSLLPKLMARTLFSVLLVRYSFSVLLLEDYSSYEIMTCPVATKKRSRVGYAEQLENKYNYLKK